MGPTTSDTSAQSPDPLPPPAVVIIGFGLPGRFVAEVLDARKIHYCVIELNPTNAASIAACRKPVVCGDARDPDLLKRAGLEAAQILAVTLPDEKIGLQVIEAARRINASIRIMARVHYTSTGIRAEKLGAFAVVVEEQIVALEFAKLMSSTL
ncbi:MAG: sodium/hydrogen exchanger [Conexibacter sp.]|nr:sodium/hydrogen exchanger [Conexibacter sp.]